MQQLTLEIGSNLSEVSLLAVAIHSLCVHAGMDHDEASQVELALVEAVTNSIRHAYHGETNHRVTVTINFDNDQLRFDLVDNGKAMPPKDLDRLVRGDGIGEHKRGDRAALAESGRGLEIIHRTMDEIDYSREGNQNCLRLTRYFGRS